MAMAATVEGLCKEATCPLCLDYFADPVITPCGHNFCRDCLAQCWGASEGAYSCPRCRHKILRGTLKLNWQLATVAALVRKLQQKKEEKLEKGLCETHREPLKFFCRDDGSPICAACDLGKEHRGHQIVPLEEAFQECQAKTNRHLDSLRKKREELKHQTCSERLRRQKCQRKLELEKMNIKSVFENMQKFLEEKQQFCLTELEDLGKEMERRTEKNLIRLSDEISHLSHLITGMEEKCRQPASEFLQDIKHSLIRYEMDSLGNMVDNSSKLEERLSSITWKISTLEEAVASYQDELEEILICEQTFKTVEQD